MRKRTAATAVAVVALALSVQFYGPRSSQPPPEPAAREPIEADIASAASEAGVSRDEFTHVSALRPSGDDRTAPPEECVITWAGRARDDMLDDEYADSIDALRRHGWHLDRRVTEGPVPFTRLRKQGWTLTVSPSRLSAEPLSRLTFTASAPSC